MSVQLVVFFAVILSLYEYLKDPSNIFANTFDAISPESRHQNIWAASFGLGGFRGVLLDATGGGPGWKKLRML